MELLQLTYFCTAAETENFSKTANIYNVPTSNISQSIRRLEKELETVLFDRTSNKISLNEQGKVFYKDIKDALKLIHNAKLNLKTPGEISGEIKILAETNRRIVTKAIENFQKNYTYVSFFIDHSCDGIYDKYDLIITDKIINQKNFEKHLLVTDKLLLAMNKSNPLSYKEEISIKDLENEKFITMNSKSGLFRLINEICNSEGFNPDFVIQSDDPYYIRKYIEMGLGVSFVPSLSWQGTFSDDVVLRKVVNINRYTFVYLNTQKYNSKATHLFLEKLIDTAKNTQK